MNKQREGETMDPVQKCNISEWYLPIRLQMFGVAAEATTYPRLNQDLYDYEMGLIATKEKSQYSNTSF